MVGCQPELNRLMRESGSSSKHPWVNQAPASKSRALSWTGTLEAPVYESGAHLLRQLRSGIARS